MVVPGPPSFFADGMMALPPPTVPFLLSTTVSKSPEPENPHPMEELGIEVLRFLRQPLPAADDRLQLVQRCRRDEKGRLIPPGAGEAHRLRLVRRVLDVRPGVELRVGHIAERLEHALMEDRYRQLTPRARRPGPPRQRVPPPGPQRQGARALGGGQRR